ncbi:dihydropteroate synthase [Sediminitomix flava]|uniref:dihydropteroate synthase n=2 Tax=Sediminitomix flava TaxID=379075 RepID=A0A315ZET6_SEDFL|nr:dihydropteroate synthase [Sediminitomix flava]
MKIHSPNSQDFINIRGQLFSLKEPVVMGILNITPDSFFSGSRLNNEKVILEKAEKMINDGAKILDIGGYSSRPGAKEVPVEEEIERVISALKSIKTHFPNTICSIDTFRSIVAKRASEYGADIINDISGGTLDKDMFSTVSSLGLPYIMMHMKGNPQNMMQKTDYNNLVFDILDFFKSQSEKFYLAGGKDLILDPGFGFAKNIEQNYQLLDQMEALQIFNLPILAGVSRKSMIWKKLGITADEALNGTTVLNTKAILNGAKILRVHDVKEAKQVIDLLH